MPAPKLRHNVGGKSKPSKPTGPYSKLTRRPKKTTTQHIKNVIKNNKELKYSPSWINYDHFDPANYSTTQLPPILGSIVLPNVYDAANQVISIVGLQTGHYLNSVSNQLDTDLTAAGQGPCMYPLGGYSMERGTTGLTIDGNEAYINSGKINIQINSVVTGSNAGSVNDTVNPLCFRILHVKAKKDAAGVSPSVAGDLFRDMKNQNAGFMSDMTQRNVFTDYAVNKQRFTVCKDVKFKLCEPVQPSYAGTSANQQTPNYPYPSQKNVTLYLDKPKKKIRFEQVDNGINNSYEPLNYDFVNYVFILCCREQINSADYSATAKRWTLTTQGQTTFRDA